MSTFRFFWSDGCITEIEANSELNARIKALAFWKDYGGECYTGMIDAQRPFVIEKRASYIIKTEVIK